jgi:hypothetical protein
MNQRITRDLALTDKDDSAARRQARGQNHSWAAARGLA